MKQENKEILLKDLCARLPYKIAVEDEYGDTLYLDYKDVHFEHYVNNILEGNIKPYLFPMSSMTEEQKRELLELTGYEPRCEESCGFDSWGFYVNIVGEYKYEENKESIILYPDDIGIDWLNANHFDFRGLIEKGLANDATGLNIY